MKRDVCGRSKVVVPVPFFLARFADPESAGLRPTIRASVYAQLHDTPCTIHTHNTDILIRAACLY
jgi:hypothetical protein